MQPILNGIPSLYLIVDELLLVLFDVRICAHCCVRALQIELLAQRRLRLVYLIEQLQILIHIASLLELLVVVLLHFAQVFDPEQLLLLSLQMADLEVRF